MLSAEDFVEVEKNGIYLSKSGKKQFIKEFEQKLYQKLQIDGMERTYDYLIKREIQRLKNTLNSVRSINRTNTSEVRICM